MILDYEERWRPTHVRVLRRTPGGPHLPPQPPLPLPRCGRGRGEDGPHLPPSPCRSSTGRGRGKMSRAAAILRLRHTRSPLSRSAGEGPGVRAALTFPPTPFRSHTGKGRGDVGGWCESMVARARNGRICTVRASCNIRVFDQAFRA